MKTRVSVLLMLAPLSAQAGLESLMNPMLLANPVANPYAMAAPLGGAMLAPGLVGSPLGGFGSPLGGFGNPLGGFGSPLGGFGSPLGGLAGPLGMAAPVAGVGVMHPAMQVAPNLMSFQHQAPQLLTNPYMGGPFSQLPFTQPSRPATPFVGGGYALPFVPSTPAYGGQAMPWGVSAAPWVPVNPYLMPAQPVVPARASSAGFNPLDLFKSPTPAAQPAAPTPAPAPSASFNPLDLLKPAAAAAPQAVASAPAKAPASASVAPVNPWLAAPAAKPEVAPAKPVAAAPTPASAPSSAAAPTQAAPLTPFDPAYWLAPLQQAAPGK